MLLLQMLKAWSNCRSLEVQWRSLSTTLEQTEIQSKVLELHSTVVADGVQNMAIGFAPGGEYLEID